MRTLFLPLLLLAAPLAAQDHPLGIFGRLTGEWEGDSWMIRGPQGRVTVRQREWVALEAGGTVVTVRGLGVLGSDTVHHAFAVIHRSPDGARVQMRAFTAEGHWLDPEIVATARRNSPKSISQQCSCA